MYLLRALCAQSFPWVAPTGGSVLQKISLKLLFDVQARPLQQPGKEKVMINNRTLT